MPYSRETDYFYKSFGDYTLYFYPAFNTGSRSTAVEFPDDTIFNKCDYKKSLPNDQFWGLQLANELSIELDFSNFTGDWVDVARWIIQGKHDDITISSTTHTELIEDQTVSNYNLWLLKKNSTTIFSGFQTPNVERVIKPEAGNIRYELSLIGAEKFILENVKLNNLNLAADNTYTDYLHDMAVNNGGNIQGLKSDKVDIDYYFNTLDSFATAIDGYARAIYSETTRSTTGNVVFDLELPNWTFYEQDFSTSDLTHPKGSALLWSNLQILTSSSNSDRTVGALVDSADSLLLYENAWSFLRAYCDFFLIKYIYTYNLTGTPVANLYKPYEAVSSNIDISGTDQSDYEIELSPLTISQATVTNITKTTDLPIQEIVNTETGTQDSETENVESVFHNYLINITGGLIVDNFTEDGIIRGSNFTPSRALWYEDEFFSGVTSAGKVHEHCLLDMGDSETFESDTTYLSTSYPADMQYYTWGDYVTRLEYYGIGRERNRALLDAFNNDNHAFINVEVGNYVNTSTTFDVTKLGETATVDFSSLVDTILQDLGTKAIVTNIEGDLINETYKVVFYLR